MAQCVTWAALCTFSACWGCCTCGGCHLLQMMMKRGEMRAHYNLDGSGFGDFLRPCCCCWCSLVQEEKEALLRNDALAAQGQAAAQGYQKEGGMVYGGQAA